MKRTALITGGAKGIGRSIAIDLARKGINVGLISRTHSDLEATQRYIQEHTDAKVAIASANIGSLREVEAAVQQLKDQLGVFDILINNAGIHRMGSVTEMDPAEFEEVIQVNLLGTYYVTRSVLPEMQQLGYGDIINISSVAGERGGPGASAYCSSKFGVMGFTESLRAECLSHKIRVSAICPSSTNTDMGRDETDTEEMLRAAIQPDDIAHIVGAIIALPSNVYLNKTSVLHFPIPVG